MLVRKRCWRVDLDLFFVKVIFIRSFGNERLVCCTIMYIVNLSINYYSTDIRGLWFRQLRTTSALFLPPHPSAIPGCSVFPPTNGLCNIEFDFKTCKSAFIVWVLFLSVVRKFFINAPLTFLYPFFREPVFSHAKLATTNPLFSFIHLV